MKEDKTLLLECLGNSPILQIVDFFLDNRLFDYSKQEIIENLGMGRATFFRYWKELEKFAVVKPTRKVGKSVLYKLDEKNEVVKKLIALDSVLCKQAMDKAVRQEISRAKKMPVPA